MDLSRRRFLGGLLGAATVYPLSMPGRSPLNGAGPNSSEGAAGTGVKPAVRYVRFQRREGASYGTEKSYGIHEGRVVRELKGKPWEGAEETGRVSELDGVRLLCPCEPTKVLAMAGNYRSHLENTPPPSNPEVFFKPPTCLLEPEGTIVIPAGTKDVHYEGELVVVIGKKVSHVDRDEASRCVFGVTCGNDVSARDWQKNDKQWWRAKGCDTFGPVGPCIVGGLDAGDLPLRTRLNGEVKQEARTSELIFDVPAIVSFISRHVTLLPGDIIFTGTPGTTSAMKKGDVVEVEIGNIGVLRNRIG